ncbi:hypothetical protein DFP72DRAFT_856529 [Ephemerocybe angulata]|uniref:Uncharacterized protein n=1 Tax=Ephemerocybe angulata TaxID=980116 RepID=A0A8H6HFE8_9AGAR|nr:hypothetical protein DFP72DRAFT_856529 [Tulosesus angulatus]
MWVWVYESINLGPMVCILGFSAAQPEESLVLYIGRSYLRYHFASLKVFRLIHVNLTKRLGHAWRTQANRKIRSSPQQAMRTDANRKVAGYFGFRNDARKASPTSTLNDPVQGVLDGEHKLDDSEYFEV